MARVILKSNGKLNMSRMGRLVLGRLLPFVQMMVFFLVLFFFGCFTFAFACKQKYSVAQCERNKVEKCVFGQIPKI